MDKLILLKRKLPTVYEIHRYDIKQTQNLILTTQDKEFAENLVNSYNLYVNSKYQSQFCQCLTEYEFDSKKKCTGCGGIKKIN